MKQQIYLSHVILVCILFLSSCKSEEEKTVEKTFNKFIEYDVSRFRGTSITVTVTPKDFEYESYKIVNKNTVSDSIRVIENMAAEYYASQLQRIGQKIGESGALGLESLELYEREYYAHPDSEYDKKRYLDKKDEFEYLLKIENDMPAQVKYFERIIKAQPYKGLHQKYLGMQKNQILSYIILVTYKLKGQRMTMELLYNGNLTEVLDIISRPI